MILLSRLQTWAEGEGEGVEKKELTTFWLLFS